MADDRDELTVEELEQAAGGTDPVQNFNQCSCNTVSGCGQSPIDPGT